MSTVLFVYQEVVAHLFLHEIFRRIFFWSVPPQIFPFEFGESLNEGETASLQCSITKGDNPVEINWYINGKPTSYYEGVYTGKLGKRMSSLSIESVGADHSGDYTCSATNTAGSTNFTTTLSVNGILGITFQ